LFVAVHVLRTATHKSKREVEQVVAQVRPQPDVPTVVRKLPTPKPAGLPPVPLATEGREAHELTQAPQSLAVRAIRPPEIKPLAPERFKVQFTVSRNTYEKLRHVQNLLRHTIPDGDPAAIFDRAVSLLLAELEKTKFAAVRHPRSGHDAKPGSRHIPAAIKRDIWRRDGGQCSFRGEQGRCSETGFLEFHHVVPFARGGATISQNLELRWRAQCQRGRTVWAWRTPLRTRNAGRLRGGRELRSGPTESKQFQAGRRVRRWDAQSHN
jgi:hypothetical protein